MTKNYCGKEFVKVLIAFDQPPFKFQTLIIGKPDFKIISTVLLSAQIEGTPWRMGIKVEEVKGKDQYYDGSYN
jgi:hypothetical protein